MTVRTEMIDVKDDDGVQEKKVDIEYTRHGPVVARKDGKAYVFRIPYFDEVGLADQTYKMVTAQQPGRNEAGPVDAATDDAEHDDRHGRRRHLLRAQRPRADPAGRLRLQAGHAGQHVEGRVAGHPQVRGPGADPKSAARLHAELQRQPAVLDEGLPAQARRPSGPICSTASTASTSSKAYDNPLHQRAAMCVDLLHDAQQDDGRGRDRGGHEPGRVRRRRLARAAAQGLERRQRRRAQKQGPGRRSTS